MSVQFFKILSGVFILHLVLLNVVWVGFSAPIPRPLAKFIYKGALPAEATGNVDDVWKKGKKSDQIIFDRLDGSNLFHWITVREGSKSLTYDHLGF